MDRLDAADDFLMDALDLLPDAIIIVNSEGVIVANSTQTLPLLGYCRNELKAKSLENIIPHKYRAEHTKKFKCFFEAHQSRRMGVGSKLWALHKDGHEVDVDIAISSYTMHNAVYSIAVMRDISDKLRLEHTIGNLEHIKEELERFGYTVSHDLKGPLQRIKLLINLITAELTDQKQKDVQVMVGYLNDSVSAMEKLIHGMLDAARMGHEANQDFVDLNEVLAEVKLTINIPDHFSIQPQKSLPKVYGNYTRWVQIFQNLITNSIKYNNKTNGFLEIRWTENDKNYQFFFSDNGVVIPETRQHLIFRLFERASDQDDKQSHGIGLFIVRNIIQTAGGDVNYRESAFGGSEFYFNWPKK